MGAAASLSWAKQFFRAVAKFFRQQPAAKNDDDCDGDDDDDDDDEPCGRVEYFCACVCLVENIGA